MLCVQAGQNLSGTLFFELPGKGQTKFSSLVSRAAHAAPEKFRAITFSHKPVQRDSLAVKLGMSANGDMTAAVKPVRKARSASTHTLVA